VNRTSADEPLQRKFFQTVLFSIPEVRKMKEKKSLHRAVGIHSFPRAALAASAAFAALAVLCLCGCPSEGQGGPFDSADHGPPGPPEAYPVSDNFSLESEIEALILGRRYYVDPVIGNDSNEGSSSLPWRTLDKALATVSGGDGVLLRSGNYGLLREESNVRASFAVFRNAAGAEPVFSGIDLDYPAGGSTAFLAFFGIRIIPDWVDPLVGAAVSPEGDLIYTKTSLPVQFTGARGVRLYCCDIKGQNKYLTDMGVSVTDSQAVTVAGCAIREVGRGTTCNGSTNIQFRGNHIYGITGSAFRGTDASSTDILIEGNHAHDSNYDYGDLYCPRAPNSNYHGSAVAVRGDRYVIRNNIFHDGFNSAGIMTYDADSPTSDIDFSDILIENNLLYDIRNDFVLRFYLIDSNVVVRNNIFAGHWRGSGAQYYDTAVVINSLSSRGDAGALVFDNNIVVGITNFGTYWPSVPQHSNIFYSCRPVNGDFFTAAEIGGNSLVACSASPTSLIFEQGFFNGSLRFDFEASDPANYVGHGETLDFTLAPGSPALGFADPLRQGEDGLGTLDEKGFIVPSAVRRTNLNHNAGAYP
jgi:hypothetical protein